MWYFHILLFFFFASLYTPRTHVTFYSNFVLETKELKSLIIAGGGGHKSAHDLAPVTFGALVSSSLVLEPWKKEQGWRLIPSCMLLQNKVVRAVWVESGRPGVHFCSIWLTYNNNKEQSF